MSEEALNVTEKEAEKVAREAARAEKEATKKQEKERKTAKKAIEKAAKENEKARKEPTSKAPISQNLTPAYLIVKVKNKQDSCTCSAILDTYNVWHTATPTSSSREVMGVINDLADVGGREKKGGNKGKGREDVKSMDISDCNSHQAHSANWLQSDT